MKDRGLTLFDLKEPEKARWVPGDQYIRPVIRRLLNPFRGHTPGGLAKVTRNLCLGLDTLGISYRLCHKAETVDKNDLVGILNGPVDACRTLAKQSSCVTGVGIITLPDEWPALFEETKAVYHLQNCKWAAQLYRRLYGEKVRIWTMGVEHERFIPARNEEKRFDFLVYDKIRWPQNDAYQNLCAYCISVLEQEGFSYKYIRYGNYPGGRESSYHQLLQQARAMLFLCENETQGFAYNEAMSMNVPLLAWDSGKWWDPQRFKYGLTDVAATSVPYWDKRCGEKFSGQDNFKIALKLFSERLAENDLNPRAYVLQHLRLEQGAKRYYEIIKEAHQNQSQ